MPSQHSTEEETNQALRDRGALRIRRPTNFQARGARGWEATGRSNRHEETQEDLSAEEEQVQASLAQAFPEIAVAWQLKEALRTWYATAPLPRLPQSWMGGSPPLNGTDLPNCAKPYPPFATGATKFSRSLTSCPRA